MNYYGEENTKEQIRLTTIHELIHAFLYDGQFEKETINEVMVEWLAKCTQMLLINEDIKKIMTWTV